MSGEFGIKVSRICFSNTHDLVCPYNETMQAIGRGVSIDLDIFNESNSVLHICGDNDWGYLVTKALLPLQQYEEETVTTINRALNEYDGKPEVIILGKNEFRAMDIMHRLRGMGEPINIFRGIPIVQSDENNCTKLLGHKKITKELSF